MEPSDSLIKQFKHEMIKASTSPSFIHHKWYVEYHLEIVDKIAEELIEFYPEANKKLVKVLVWIHDYGKTLDFNNQYDLTPIKGREKLVELGFDRDFTDKVIEYIQIIDRKLELEISQAPIEVQIVSSADGCSHFVGPFMSLWWYENPNKTIEELMQDNTNKANKDWNRKIVLPEARQAFEPYYKQIIQQSGNFPDKFLS